MVNELKLMNQVVKLSGRLEGKRDWSKKNLSEVITNKTTQLYLSGQEVSLIDNQLWNVCLKKAIEIYLIDPEEVISLSDDPQINALCLDEVSTYKGTATAGRNVTSKLWRETDPAGFSAALSHYAHLVNLGYNNNRWTMLKKAHLVNVADEKKFIAAVKTFQSDWVKMTTERSYWSEKLVEVVDSRGGSLNDIDANDWSVDYLIEKNSIIVALKFLKKANRLSEVSAWKLLRLVADPSYGNLRLVLAEENVRRGEGTEDFANICQKILKEDVPESQQESQVSVESQSLYDSFLEVEEEEVDLTLYNQVVLHAEPLRNPKPHNKLDLTGRINKKTSALYFSGQYLGVREGKLYNIIAEKYIDIYLIKAPEALIDFSDVPEFSVLQRGKAAYRGIGASERHISSRLWKEHNPAGYSVAESHMKHLVLKGGYSHNVWYFLQKKHLVDLKDQDLWVAAAKTFQGAWIAMTEDSNFWSPDLQALVSPGKTLNDINTAAWSVDYKLERANVANALADLQREDRLHEVSGWKLMRLMMDPSYGNIQLVKRNLQRPNGKDYWDEIYNKVLNDDFIADEPASKRRRIIYSSDDEDLQ